MTPEWRRVLSLSPSEAVSLQGAVAALHAWYRRGARDLPWRRTSDPYAIWVSEVMLQQTRVAVVVPYFDRWMTAFPSISSLATADEGLVFKLWEGLGYYSRARNLHLAAKAVVHYFGGVVPRTPSDFLSLPGVGEYTAAAVLSIAFGCDLPVLDGNVVRVFSRLVALDAPPLRAPAKGALRGLAEHLLPPGTAGVHNQALMELGARVCTPRSPRCFECPLLSPCRAARSERPEAYPVKQAKNAPPHQAVSLGIVCNEGRVFIDQRPYGKLLGGLWEFPGGKIEAREGPEDALVRELREEFGLEVEVGAALPPVEHAYTHLRVTLHPFLCRFVSMRPQVGEGRPFQWVLPGELARVAMPGANRKILEALRLRGAEAGFF